jgi:hypothetical protein
MLFSEEEGEEVRNTDNNSIYLFICFTAAKKSVT